MSEQKLDDILRHINALEQLKWELYGCSVRHHDESMLGWVRELWSQLDQIFRKVSELKET